MEDVSEVAKKLLGNNKWIQDTLSNAQKSGTLDLSDEAVYNNIAIKASKLDFIKDIIVPFLQANPNVTTLKFGDNPYFTFRLRKPFENLSQCSNLKYLILADTPLEQKQVQNIMSVFSKSTTLETLDLSGHNLSYHSIKDDCTDLANCKSLKKLILANTSLSEQDVTGIIDAFSTNKTLDTLDFSDNKKLSTSFIEESLKPSQLERKKVVESQLLVMFGQKDKNSILSTLPKEIAKEIAKEVEPTNRNKFDRPSS